MNKTSSKTWVNPNSALTITRAELIAFGITEAEIAAGESRGKLKTRGPWQLPVSFRALCMSATWGDASNGHRDSATCYGLCTLSAPREAGHALEGRVRVSVNGKSVRGFTSSQLFELEDGTLVNVATIHACV